MPIRANDQIEFRPSSAKAIICLLVCLVFVALSIFLLVEVGMESWKDVAAYGFSLLFFGSGMVVFTWTLISPTPHIVVDEAGLRLPGATDEAIPWGAIAQLSAYRAGRYDCLGLVLHEPQRYLRSDSIWKRLLNRLTRVQGYHISIATTGLNGSQRDIERAIQRFSGHRFFA